VPNEQKVNSLKKMYSEEQGREAAVVSDAFSVGDLRSAPRKAEFG